MIFPLANGATISPATPCDRKIARVFFKVVGKANDRRYNFNLTVLQVFGMPNRRGRNRRMKRMIVLIIFLTIVDFVFAEEIRLRSGVVKKGEIVEKTDQDVTLKDENGGMVTIPFNMVSEDQVGTLQALPKKTISQAVSNAVSGSTAGKDVQPGGKVAGKPASMEPVIVKPVEVLPKQEMTDEDKLMDQVFELNGTKEWLNHLFERAERMPQGAAEEVSFATKDVEAFKKFKADVYGADRINRYFYQFIKKYYDEKRFKAARDFLSTPLARKITEREKATAQLTEQDLKTEYEVFAKDKPTEKRYALISGLIHASKLLRLELASLGYTRVLMFKRVKFQMTEEQLGDEVAHLVDEQGYGAKGALEGMFPEQGFLCRNFSDQELEEYIQNLSSPDIEYVQESIYQAIVETFARMRTDYVSGLKEHFSDSTGDHAGAETPPLETLDQKRERVRALTEQSEELQRRGDMKHAQEVSDQEFSLMEQLLFLNPDDMGLCVALGISYQMWHYRVGRAAVLLEKAIALGTQIPQAYLTLGYIYLEWGNLDRAEELFKKTLALSTDDMGKTQSYYALGNVYREKNQLDRAIDVLEKAITLDPKDSGSYGLLGIIAAQQGKIEMAEKYLKQAEQLGLDAGHIDALKAMIRKNKKSAWPL